MLSNCIIKFDELDVHCRIVILKKIFAVFKVLSHNIFLDLFVELGAFLI